MLAFRATNRFAFALLLVATALTPPWRDSPATAGPSEVPSAVEFTQPAGNADATQPQGPHVVTVRRLHRGLDTGFEIIVKGLAEPSDQELKDRKAWVLHFDGEPVPKMVPSFVGRPADSEKQTTDWLFRYQFDHERPDTPAWRALFSRASYRQRNVISVGPVTGDAAAKAMAVPFKSLMAPTENLVVVGVAYVLLVVILILVSRRTTLLKDGPYFSLGRSQMAFWFLITAGAYLFIGIVMGTWSGTISAQALSLMGISAVTGVTAAAITSDKGQQAVATAAAPAALADQKTALNGMISNPGNAASVPMLAEQLKVVNTEHVQAIARAASVPAITARSNGFWRDIVSDDKGIALHRLQIVVWTVIIGAVFALRVVMDLVMPDLDTTLLTLMGISSGTYLGFKLPEKP